ncbi:MAG: response regulator [Rhizorhabdus sp.]|uniref:ATP-binding protein n=1 Tax=Rhizorhabdus sp. TaxID=1968843 RepID=UPI001B5F1292|nr:ATP-binding protein [Rhizorhabdus sp.]MBP8232499.1 response regulator [Rhizorhabdus sp.]
MAGGDGETSTTDLDLLAGGGELGALMRAFDWKTSPLGPPEHWPQSLKTTVRIMLTSRQPIWVGWGPELTYLYNDAYRSIIGARHPWALGKPTAEVWSEIRADIEPMLAQAMQGDEGIYVEEQLLIMERNGYPEETYYTFSYSPIPDDQGRPGGIICANSDDTAKVIGKRQLALLTDLANRAMAAENGRDACQASVAALAAAPRDIPFALLFLEGNEPGTLEQVASHGVEPGSPLAPALLQDGDSFAGQPLFPSRLSEPVEIEDIAGFASEEASAIWGRPPRSALILPLPASERRGVLVAGISPVRQLDAGYRDFLGLVAGQIGTAVAKADAYQAERQRAEALAEIDRAKTIFFSNVSHEFRTPLTLMLGPVEELLKSTDGAAHDLAAMAHRNGLRLLRLVNTLLDFARIEVGRTEGRFEPTDLASVTADLASNFRSACEQAGLTLELRTSPLPQPVYVDRSMWEKIVLNLLSNAFKYTLAGRISVEIRSEGDMAVVVVADSGVGIAADEIPRLFDRFHRIEGQPGRTQEGTGIGLALVKELVGLHGGMIAVESELGRGTRFTVTLPTGSAHLPREQVTETPAARPSSTMAEAFVEEGLRWPSSPAPLGDTTSPPSVAVDALAYILVADDNADMRDHIAHLLRPIGYQVETVTDGEAALAAMRARKPDLVISDVMMPRLDGFGLLREIRADPELRATPVLMLSARAGEEATVDGIQAGADDYLTKPFAARELIARVNANLSIARARLAVAEQVRASELRLRRLFENAPGFIAILNGPEFTFEFVNKTYIRMFGDRDYLGRPFEEVFTELGSSTIIRNVFLTGERYRAIAVPARLEGGLSYALDFVVEPIRDMDGVVTGIFLEGHDVSERNRAETALFEESRTLDTLNRSGIAIAAELDLPRLVQMVTDAGVEVTGAQFGAFFHIVKDDGSDSYMLYSLSGADRAAFEHFPMPRQTGVFGPTFRGERVIRSGDITQDPRYGKNTPHRGMPEGHMPVRSYLAAPVRSRSGEILGGLFFGHAEPDRFNERHERLIVGIAAQAAIAMDNARLFDAGQREIAERKRAEEELRELNETLERRIAEALAEREVAEEALRQSQKMEAVGQLTGGVAHDFNNLLTIITGNLDIMLRAMDRGDEARIRRAIESAQKGADRAASLTQRLLAFSRRQPLAPKPIDVDRLVSGMSELLTRALGETISLEVVTTSGLWRVEADPNQLENCLINLAVNARDAMPGGGALTIETANARLDEEYSAAHAEVAPGQYVVIAVSDTGVGMSREVLGRVFEPFFTTKEVGRGTGLGLSMVYGFVKQSGGHVKIYSEEGSGTTIKIYLPRLLHDIDPAESEGEMLPGGRGRDEVILVAEDDDDVRAYTAEILRELGYRVIEAPDGAAALSLVEQPDQPIDLLFTDVVMPNMSGQELASRAQAIRPGLKVLYTSGYTRNAIVHNGRLDAGVEMIAKPFTYQALSARIREILDAVG